MRVFCTILTASVLALACSGSDDHAPALGSYPLPECPQLDVAPCDTRSPACQRRLLELAACVYGVESAPDVPIRVVDEAQLIDELEDAAGEDADPDAAAGLPHVEQALASLQLLAPGDLTEGHGSTEDLVDRVDGVYQDAEHGIALVDRGMPKNDAESGAVLVHELVHAIQDASYDLNDWRRQYPGDLDTTLALRSVSEGQATYAQFRVLYAMLGYDLARFDLSDALDTFRSRLFRSAHADPSPYLASLTTFPYAAGVGTAARAWSRTGLHFAAGQFEDPPLSTLAALSASYALELPTPDPSELPPPSPDPDHSLVESSALGAFILELFLSKQGFDAELSRTLALDWRRDRLWIYAGPDDTTGFLWELELQSTDWDSFFDRTPTAEAGLSREHQGRRLFIAGRDAPPEFLLTAGRAFLAESG